ncbi:MAG TPA: Rv3654c family TadE-like protein [Pseudonocardia sp.]
MSRRAGGSAAGGSAAESGPGLIDEMSRRRGVESDRGQDRGQDRGVATLWAAGAMSVVLAVMVVGINLGAAASSRHRAEAAADLAALAAASHAGDGEAAACAHGARVAHGMSARLVSCRLAGWEAAVEIEVRPSLALGSWGVAHGRARAGPVTGDQ